ncbi:hypothetical protein BC834DRAFT_159640 [Gloeopeniophorella convolvens]|nr:hypothetical protein BC834DRAFT_159640 [Gloeopeniophorella convolvens]
MLAAGCRSLGSAPVQVEIYNRIYKDHAEAETPLFLHHPTVSRTPQTIRKAARSNHQMNVASLMLPSSYLLLVPLASSIFVLQETETSTVVPLTLTKSMGLSTRWEHLLPAYSAMNRLSYVHPQRSAPRCRSNKAKVYLSLRWPFASARNA